MRSAPLLVAVAAIAAVAMSTERKTGAQDRYEALAQRAAQNGSCAGCHPDIATEWQRSLHQHAWKDDVFQKAFEVEPLPFCRGCHAPESDPNRQPTARAADIGVSCVTCHVQTDGVHGTKAAPKADHAVIVDRALGTPAACARCHQFDFPADANQVHPQPMQDTVAEHAASSKADTPCQSCHMPIVDGPDGKHRSHAFSVIADQAMIERAVTVRAERSDTTAGPSVHLVLTAAQIGHAFPTGDMFRRVEVRAFAVDVFGKVVARAEPFALQRRFEDRPRDPSSHDFTFTRVEAEDSRVPPPGLGERSVRLTLPAAALRTKIVWSVVYQRMSTPMASAFGVEPVLDEIVVAKGELSPHLVAHNTGGLR